MGYDRAPGSIVAGGKRAVLIAGPTASGKSALALQIAEAEGGAVINADSMQVYEGLHILTARPSADEEARVPHRLYGHVPPSERYSVARWREAAGAAIAHAWAEGRLPIVVGGTGLYFRALTEGLVALPPIPPDLRARLEAEALADGVPALHRRLAAIDPDGASRLKPGDRTRVLRALEVVEATGRPLRAWHADPAEPPLIPPDDALRIVIEPERPVLYERIETRFDNMVEAGALAEVSTLLERRLDPGLPAMKAIGVPEFARHLAGEWSLDEAIVRAKMETRRYAKRQTTWFRHQMADWQRR